MKTLIPIFALALVGLVSPAFAVDLSGIMSQSPCEEAGGVWDTDAGKCLAKAKPGEAKKAMPQGGESGEELEEKYHKQRAPQ